MTLRVLYVHVVSNSVTLPQILNDIVLYALHFLPVIFFPSITLINYVSSYRKCNVDRLITCLINTSISTNEVRLAHHIS